MAHSGSRATARLGFGQRGMANSANQDAVSPTPPLDSTAMVRVALVATARVLVLQGRKHQGLV